MELLNKSEITTPTFNISNYVNQFYTTVDELSPRTKPFLKQDSSEESDNFQLHDEANAEIDDDAKSNHDNCPQIIDEFYTKPLQHIPRRKIILKRTRLINSKNGSDIKDEATPTKSSEFKLTPSNCSLNPCVMICNNQKTLKVFQDAKEPEESGTEDIKSTIDLNDDLEGAMQTDTDYKHLILKSETKSAANKQTYACPICSHTSANKGNLKVHIRVHTGERNYQCKQCPYKATQSSSLKTHCLLIHGKAKKYKCEECSYKTSLKCNLVKHSLIHTGEKKFKCAECDFRAIQKSCVITHIILKHTSEKYHKCSKCDYATALKGNLKKHEKRHN